ncbi:MAG: hypothetical protein V1659_03855 [Candidatus Woesearchaeota archaeon]
MAIITIMEIIDALAMILAVGFIFRDAFVPQARNAAHNLARLMGRGKSFDWGNFWFACAIVAPAILLHELAHKFVALGFGMEAVFHTFYLGLAIGLVLKLINFGFIFFVPGYVAISGTGTPLQFTIISFAGPFVHLILWLGSWLLLSKVKKMSKRTEFSLILIKKINLFLFILNMLPIPGLDGFKVYSGIIQMLF